MRQGWTKPSGMSSPPRVAVVGGGISGACAASVLRGRCEVVLFDQGRRGPGGRASHRSVNPADGKTLSHASAEDAALEFDHGCQFTRADSAQMQQLVAEWVERGWIAQWEGRFGVAPQGEQHDANESECGDFFGLPSTSG